MTKKIVSILIAMIYLNLSIGLSLNAHFCQNEIKSIDLFSSENSSCCSHHENQSCDLDVKNHDSQNNEEKTNDNCCSNHHIEIKLDTDQFYSNSKLKIKSPETKVFFKANIENELHTATKKSFRLNPNLKEAIPKIPFRILYSNFTLYA